MAKISTFIYCEGFGNTNNPQNSKNSASSLAIFGPMQILTPPFIPGSYSFGILIGVIDLDMSIEHSFEFTFTEQDEKTSLFSTNKIQITPQERITLKKELQGFMINFDLRNVVFKKGGLYIGKAYIDKEEIGEMPINVMQSSQGDKNAGTD
jgi:hypothetical protein